MISGEEPTAGFYRMRLVRGGPLVGIKIWHGAPLDPVTLDIMDRGYRWNALANGEWIDLDRVWPQCTGDPITEQEYGFLTDRTAWARRNDAFDPMATPRRRANWDDSTVPDLGA